MSRRYGLSAFADDMEERLAEIGREINDQQKSELTNQLSTFQEALKAFAREHAAELRQNASFRKTFAQMAIEAGLDPLVSGPGASAWSAVGMSNFDYQVAVRVIEVCQATQQENGGLLSVSTICQNLNQENEASGQEWLVEQDIVRAVNNLKVLGPGCVIENLGKTQYVRTLPLELSGDQTKVLQAAQVLGYITVDMLRDNLGWELYRCQCALKDLVGKSLVWVDEQAKQPEYWSASTLLERS
ncbi:EAP30 family protein Dot2 [Schizosaccharomyces japonicus yFS275]|uniref:EAP30 family protein Dot2 n=1 Tax=Schizosaccharomyces japonicus (strain yFS275 / FY16936) TaxID=402676 RepID=B6K860_SCHJY|nr:EAP30 family protein Dot2 [Schizosaccharomyces japonicus yFS275]EEB09714.1 EAP30 family protein Dot2 [Schizosaccharomyces japonicus yFS275]